MPATSPACHPCCCCCHRAAFTFKKLPFKVPYPVPFKLLGDERKGFIDITYLSPDGRLRLSRGNKASGGSCAATGANS
jgi:hypothetical protein